MKINRTKLILFLSLILVSFSIQAQTTLGYKGIVNKKFYKGGIKGTPVEVLAIEEDEFGTKKARILSGGKSFLVPLSNLKNITFIPSNTSEFWACQALNNGVYQSLFGSKGFQYEQRKEMEGEARDVLRYLADNGLLYEDSYLESYLYSLLYKIFPAQLNDGRPGFVNVVMVKQIEPAAAMYPDGTLVLSTGLLSTVHSEEELMAIMAGQVAHFVLDHALINVNKAVARQQRAVFFATLATISAAVVETQMAAEDPYYIPGALTYGTALVSFSLAATVNDRFGLRFSVDQQMESDAAATQLLKFIQKDTTALPSALLKIRERCIANRDFYALTNKGDFFALDERLAVLAKPNAFDNTNYDKHIASAISFNAILEFNAKHFATAQLLVQRNIRAGVATDEDLILLSKTITLQYDTKEHNEEALYYVRKAKEQNAYPNLTQFKQEAIVLMRLGRYKEAGDCLNLFCQQIEKEKQELEKIKNPDHWYNSYVFYSQEYDWGIEMLYKIASF